MTTPESPSALLERAAATLEQLAADTTAGTWQARDLPDEPGQANVLVESVQSFGGFSSLFTSSCCGGQCYGHVDRRGDAAWIAALSPAVAPPLVEWLRHSATSVREHDEDAVANGEPGRYCPNEEQALSFARLVLGEPENTP